MSDYPAHLARERTLADGRRVLIRPIRPEDEPREAAFFSALSEDAKRMRFMKYVAEVNQKLLRFFTRIDYDKHMAFVCETREGNPRDKAPGVIVGEARYVANPDGRSCEFGIVIADAWHGTGIAGLLMEALIRAAFEVHPAPEDPQTVRVVRKL
jgi:acetyltransferase